MTDGGVARELGDSGVAPVRHGPQWWLYRGTGQALDPTERDQRWPEPPPWRDFPGDDDLPAPPPNAAETQRRLGSDTVAHVSDRRTVDMVNAAIYLSRPLIVTGRPGTGKSALAHLISRELGLGRVLQWPITSRATLRSGLYEYDAFGHAQAVGSGGELDIGNFIHLGPLGTALLPHRLPRVLLIDELDKSDIDLPNDLLSVFEEGEFTIRELVRVRDRDPQVMVHAEDPGVRALVRDGIVRCHAFPIVVITSNEEREFPSALLRRCLTVRIPDPTTARLAEMVAAHFQGSTNSRIGDLIHRFVEQRQEKDGLAVDQLLNAVQLATSGAFDGDDAFTELLDAIWHRLSAGAG